MNKYELVDMIGEGAYGIVMKCLNKLTREVVAIKKFKETEDDPAVQKTILREISILRSLHHPNIIKMVDSFRIRRKLYLVFEHMPRNLLNRLTESPAGLAPSLIRAYMYQLCQALAFVHHRSFVHRDIKPENVLVGDDDGGGHPKLKLCDFGFARRIDGATRPTDLTEYVSTRWYRAPELLVRCHDYSAAIDVFALGCIMAELIDGEPLFPGDDDLDQLYLINRCLGPMTGEQRALLADRRASIANADRADPAASLDERYGRRVDRRTLQFLKGTLRMDPTQRLTSAECLAHPYFDGVRDAGSPVQRRRPRKPLFANRRPMLSEMAPSAAMAVGLGRTTPQLPRVHRARKSGAAAATTTAASRLAGSVVLVPAAAATPTSCESVGQAGVAVRHCAPFEHYK